MDSNTISLLVILLAAIVLPLIFGCIAIYLLQRLLAQQARGGDRLLGATAQLRESIGALDAALKELPSATSSAAGSSVTEGVKPLVTEMQGLVRSVNGLTPLPQALQASHNSFQAAVMTLAEPGALQDWTCALQEAVQPLRAVEAGLIDHYRTSQGLLATMGQMLGRWDTHQTEIEKAYQEAATLLVQWAGDERLSRAEIERRIMDRLSEVGAQNNRMTETMSTLQTEVQRLVTGTDNLRATIQGVDGSLERLANLQKQVARDQKQVAEGLQQIETEVAQRQREVGERLTELASTVTGLSKESQSAQAAMTSTVSSQLDTVKQSNQVLLENLHKAQVAASKTINEQLLLISEAGRTLNTSMQSAQAKALEQLDARQRQYITEVQKAAEKQDAVLEAARKAVADLPSRSEQKAGNGRTVAVLTIIALLSFVSMLTGLAHVFIR